MPKRLEHDEVAKRISLRGYTLKTPHYINDNQLLEIQCQKVDHPPINCTFNNFQAKSVNCKYCIGNINGGEEICRGIMQKIFPNNEFNNIRLPCMDGLELDGYCEELSLAFEYNGVQHYKHVPHFHRDYTFEEQQERDQKKVKLCTDNNIKLIIIPYTNHQFIQKITCIKEQLIELNIEFDDNIEIKEDEIIKMIGELKTRNLKFYAKCVEAAEKKGGKCLSTGYVDNKVMMDFECKEGHKFQMCWSDLNRGRFCKFCANNQKLNDDVVFKELKMYGYIACPDGDPHQTKYTKKTDNMWLIHEATNRYECTTLEKIRNAYKKNKKNK